MPDDGKQYDSRDVKLPHEVLKFKKTVVDMNKFKGVSQLKSQVMCGIQQDIIDIKAGTFKLKTTSTQEILRSCVKYWYR